MKYFKLNAPEELPRRPFVDKQCVGEKCMAWKLEAIIKYVSSEGPTKTPYPVQENNIDRGYCGAIWK